MRNTEIRRDFGPGTVTLRLSGTLDGRVARQLREQIDQLPLDREVTIDFTGVAPFSDLAIAVLAQEIRSVHRSLDLVGLTRHQERMFRYFGVPLITTEPWWGEEMLT